MRRLRNSVIPEEYWQELNNTGTTVPRDKKTGEVIEHNVGTKYKVKYLEGKEWIVAICTQNCPYHLRKLTEEELNNYNQQM